MPRVTLEDLASAEAEIERIVIAMHGTIEEMTARLRAKGVFGRYSELFSSYLSLAEPPCSDGEALKRATFLSWYEVTEPSCFSGVADLPEDARHRVLALIEPLVHNLDDEFRWMLAYYFQIADYAFPALASHPKLDALLRAENPEGWLSHRAATERMSGRGLMGQYWLSVFGSSAA